MNPQPSTIRSLIAVGAGLALTLAACSGGDDDTATTTAAPAPTTAESSDGTVPGGMPAMEPALIAFDEQASDGSTITISSVELPAAGFIAVHSDADGSPGPVIGTSKLLSPGASTDVEITLDTPLTADTTLFPMVHIDTNGNGVYEFGEVDGVDGPALTPGGEVAVVGAAVTVDESGSNEGAATDDAPDAEGDTITIADFAFSGVTEVAVGTTIVVTNTDSAPHTWTAVDGAFDSGSLGQDETFEFTFDTPGSFEYFCNFHPSMTGTITVTG